MKNLSHVFREEFFERLITLRENLHVSATLKLELHLRVAARAANDPLEHDLAQLERELNQNPEAFFKLELPTSNPKSLQVLDTLGLKAVPLEVDGRFLEAFEQESKTRRSSLQNLILSWRANPNDVSLDQATLELHRLRVAARTIQHPLESWFESLEKLLEKADLEGFAALLETQVTDAAAQVPPETPNSSQSVVPKPTSTDSVRVNVQRLDTLLAQAGELTISRIRLENRTRNLGKLVNTLQVAQKHWRSARSLGNRLASNSQTPEFQEFLGFFDKNEDRFFNVLENLEQLLQDLAEDSTQLRSVNTIIETEVLAVRLMNASNLFPNLERLVRDLSQSLGKRAKFETLGGEIGLDRKILDGLRDPLMHMVRNALDHGLETPEVRKAAGKPEIGTIRLEVRQTGSTIEITLGDDGAGINTARVRTVAQARGLLAKETVFDQEKTLELLFAPGFSTATSISQTSGRGVGMDVVRENVRALNGSISLQSQTGCGSSFHLRLPTTLVTSRVLVMRVAQTYLAIPTSAIERVARVRVSDLVNHQGQPAVILEGHAVRVIELATLLELPSLKQLEPDDWRVFVNLHFETKQLCLMVDALIGEQEIVVKKLGYPLENLAHLQGAAVLDSGMLVPILNSQTIIQKGLSKHISSRPFPAPKAKTRILVVDDSITTRALERSILENAGFETRVAINGIQALEILQTEEIQLVLSDVEMPLMDGFALTTTIRGMERFRHIPVILVTSLNTPEYKQRGAQAGADAYIIKSEFDQTVLLETVARLL
jgi:two-component system, chemotaxis family, sensor kinase CheA